MRAKAGSDHTLTIQPAGGTGQHARPHQTFAQPLKVRLVDSRTGNPVSDAPVTFSWEAMTQQALFEGDRTNVTAPTDAQGYAQTPPLVAGDAAGTVTFLVTAEGAVSEEFEVTVDG
ncbi:Ig domain-containing protein [Streptomyces sp. NPDC101227]|uniref:Ig domain-containing protein n=1 Tax=Streptomyces sp. NPDC101227 TaxID=3366136 RepID=UPI00382247CC